MRLTNSGYRTATITRRRVLTLAGGSALTALSLPLSGSAQAAEPAVPSRGFNLPDWLDRKDGIAPSEAVLEKLRQTGFESVRLPVNGDLISAGDTAALHRIRDGVMNLVGRGFAVIVDMHPSASLHTALRDDFDAGAERAARAWTALRDVIADLPASSVYPELLNEPPLERGAWIPLRDRLAETVRDRCPLHTLVWGPAPYQGIWELNDTPPLADDNQIAAIHFYAPMAFTHQCQTWDTSSPLARIANLPFPATKDTPRIREFIEELRAAGDEQAATLIEEQSSTPWTEAAIAAEFAGLAHWSKTQGCPVMMNEFGVLNFCVDAESRTFWVRAVRQAAEAHGIGWTYWELDQGFGFIGSRLSTEGFDRSMIAALIGDG
ncbi:cellulase family glycosylhydrolase [Neorhizobium sp. CSC1952]|uniref:glycoside hydrolase family 5 protein n=1 Tax=Neorhizobium sp. CSC1952 TaxID=2978974 RepID=UPI0025A65A81|nr:cellulase family glycosylhydrolase [Rhizobium sp. CSC1952]WJR68285.1 cellulase family glycosylhydrolase [Rhizobium sp. CSC1952]